MDPISQIFIVLIIGASAPKIIDALSRYHQSIYKQRIKLLEGQRKMMVEQRKFLAMPMEPQVRALESAIAEKAKKDDDG